MIPCISPNGNKWRMLPLQTWFFKMYLKGKTACDHEEKEQSLGKKPSMMKHHTPAIKTDAETNTNFNNVEGEGLGRKNRLKVKTKNGFPEKRDPGNPLSNIKTTSDS